MVYKDCSVLCMDYACLGTLAAAIRVLHGSSSRLSLTLQQQQVTMAAIALEVSAHFDTKFNSHWAQMVQAVSLLHLVDVLHCDIKPGKSLLLFIF